MLFWGFYSLEASTFVPGSPKWVFLCVSQRALSWLFNQNRKIFTNNQIRSKQSSIFDRNQSDGAGMGTFGGSWTTPKMSQTCSYMLYIHVLVHYKISDTSNELGKGGFENFVDTTTLSFHIDPFINYDTGHFNVPQKSHFLPCGAEDTGFRRLAPRGSLPKRSGEKILKIDHTIVKKNQIGRRELFF